MFIKDYHSREWTIEMMCRVLGVSRSSYYRWLKEPLGKRARKQLELREKIRDSYFEAKGRNGSPRLVKDLQANGVSAGLSVTPWVPPGRFSRLSGWQTGEGLSARE